MSEAANTTGTPERAGLAGRVDAGHRRPDCHEVEAALEPLDVEREAA